MENILEKCGIQKRDVTDVKGLYFRELISGDKIINFIFNRRDVPQEITIPQSMDQVKLLTNNMKIYNNGEDIKIVVNPCDVGVYITR